VKVVLCCPTLTQPHQALLDAIRAEVPLLDEAEIDHSIVWEIGCPYISHARASMLRKALDTQPDCVVFLDHDVSWKPGDLVRLIQTEGQVVAGTYRFKKAVEEFMGVLKACPQGSPLRREDGCLLAEWIPAGFLKITAQAVHDFIGAYPELLFGSRYRPHVDLFNHGAHEWLWYGEDYAFSRRFNDMGGQIWLIPDLEITHHTDTDAYPGNFHEWLMRQPGGINDPARAE
jgi:glycosyltransferase involved in cell wall biosynthesis